MFYVAILVPFILTYLFNITIYFIIVFSLTRQVIKKRKIFDKGELHIRKEYKRLAIIAFFLAIMFGLAWIFAILVLIPDTYVSLVFQYLFSCFIAVQGVLYFIMHGLRSPDARKLWMTFVYKPCPSRMPDYLKSGPTSTPYQHAQPRSAQLRQNPFHGSQDNLLTSGAESTFNTLERTKADIGASPSAYSLASQTLQIDFPLPALISDDETSSMDMQDLTEFFNTKFVDPTAPGVAVSPPRMPISSAHESIPTSSLLTSITASETYEMTTKEFALHVEVNKDALAADDDAAEEQGSRLRDGQETAKK